MEKLKEVTTALTHDTNRKQNERKKPKQNRSVPKMEPFFLAIKKGSKTEKAN